MLMIKAIAKRYKAVQVLNGVSLSCSRGKAVCLAGANAAGKTTLLTIAAGLDKADSGSVESDARIGFVPQENAQMTDLSVRDNLSLWYSAFSRSENVFGAGSPETEMGLLPFAKKRVSTLSGGIKKRTAIACALACRPGYLLMDEPFAALDLVGKSELIQLLNGLLKQQVGILFSSHDPVSIARFADEVMLLANGEISRSITLPRPDGDENDGLRERTAVVSALLSGV